MTDATTPIRTLAACDLGPVPYREGLALQEGLVAARAAGETGDWLLYSEHPPVLTVGRHPSEGNLRVSDEALARLGIERVEVSRGGDITWHGPGQLVGYPILDLESRGRDLHAFLRGLETVLVDALAHWGLEAGTVPGRTGVWCDGEKIASIGIAVRRWVSYHGFALNVNPGLAGFDLIHPCGLHGIRMTSLAERLGDAAPGLAEVRERVTAEFAAHFGYARVRWAGPAEAHERAVTRAERRGVA